MTMPDDHQMKKILLTFLLAACSLSAFSQNQAAVQDSVPAVNYDKSKIRPYVLEDPLRFVDGSAVETVEDWERRRVEILDIFQHEMFGVLPPVSPVFLEELESGTTLSGFGLRRQVRMWFREDRTGPKIDWLIVTPTHVKGPVPAVILLNSFGNQAILDDPQILLTDCWLRNKPDIGIENFHATEKTRGFYVGEQFRSTFPVASILARGYALVTACYGEVSPDPERVLDENGVLMQDEFAYTGVFDLWGRRDPSRLDNTTSLMAWAWALMRGMDMIERDPHLDETRVVVTGASRLAKAALLAAAYDTRFPVVVPVQCGGGGVKLAKRNYGESIAAETFKFRHWYCRAYDKYAGNEDKMPFDQHLLVASIAPRSILVEGFGSPWFDTEGEYLSVMAADTVWKKFGFQGVHSDSWPDVYDTSAIGDRLGYVRRDQLHGISPIDWKWMLDFADRNFEADVKPEYTSDRGDGTVAGKKNHRRKSRRSGN